ncbi:hypothetical protein [Vallicoccus soli]|uniref:hypothetical protein n=1 Tax=Vallicoccus soli TaxID=2339232 RepID=UPI001403C891|nr:hypothetical protein [Vallicoccus soli]
MDAQFADLNARRVTLVGARLSDGDDEMLSAANPCLLRKPPAPSPAPCLLNLV